MTDKALNLFISYSHIDEQYFEEFKKHLITLKRNNVIQDYDDLKIMTGDVVDNEIMKMLEKADIIAFLISIDFLNSTYCYEIELKYALSKLKNGEIKILPIVIRQCKWQDSIFKEYLSATKNGNPVSKYDDHDDAWCEVVDNIKRLCIKINELKECDKKKKTMIN